MKINRRLFLMFAFAPIVALAQEKVQIHVYVKPADGGFVDSSRPLDTAKDLSEIISKRKGLAYSSIPEEAALTLEVVSSGLMAVAQTETQTRLGTFGGVNSTTTQKQLPGIVTRLRVRGTDYEKEISFIQQMFWKDLAKRIVDQVEDWVKVNRANIPKR